MQLVVILPHHPHQFFLEPSGSQHALKGFDNASKNTGVLFYTISILSPLYSVCFYKPNKLEMTCGVLFIVAIPFRYISQWKTLIFLPLLRV